MSRVLFARVGWMRFYKGLLADDQGPVGGGKYNDTAVGEELYNFFPVGGKVFGYFQPALAPKGTRDEHPSHIALERIQSGFQGDSLDDVRVIFVATHPLKGRQRIVGWYPSATVYRHCQEYASVQRESSPYFITGSEKDALLVPEPSRDFLIPSGKGAFGRANVCYALDEKGAPKENSGWMEEAVAYTESYKREDLAQDPAIESDDQNAENVAETIEHSAGFQSNPLIRSAIEKYAMNWAFRYLTKLKFAPVDMHRNRPYDFVCIIEGTEVFVEVKGMQDSGKVISLTPREVKHAQDHRNSALFVVHSVTVEGQIKPRISGGQAVFRYPWDISAGVLKPRGFVLTLGD